jgi:uncharacterized membrane protein YfcA
MAVIAGFLLALVIGLTGVGAGTLTAPVLILLFGMSPTTAVGTSLVFGAAVKLVAAPIYLVRRQVDFRVLLRLCLGGAPGVLVGALVIGALSLKRYENLLLLLVGALVASLALYNIWNMIRNRDLLVRRDRSWLLPWIAAGIGVEVGFSSAGAGAIGSIALLRLTPLPPAKVVGTDIMFGLVLSLIGGGLHVSAGRFDPSLLPGLLVGGLAGVLLGANLAAILPKRPLRAILSVCLVFLGVQLCLRGLF